MKSSLLTCALPLSVFLCAAPALAVQAQGGGGAIEDPTTFDWRSSEPWDANTLGSAGTLSKMRAGDLDGDDRLDVILRGPAAPGGSVGSYTLLFLLSPAVGAATLLLSDTANDFDFQPGSPAGRIVTVDSTGLKRLAWTGVGPSFFASETVSTATEWLNASLVRVADLDGAGPGDFVGVAADRRTVILRSDGGAGVQTVLVNTADDVIELLPVQWIQGGGQEVAILTSTSLSVCSNAGLILASFTLATPGNSLATVVPVGTAGPDRIAWAVPGSSPTQTWTLSVLRSASPQVENSFNSFTVGAVGLAAADMNLDGDHDLFVTRSGDRKVRVFTNGMAQSTATAFATSRTQLISHSSLLPAGALPNAAMPLLGDFRNRPRPCLLVPVQTATETRFELFQAQGTTITSEEAFNGNQSFGAMVNGNNITFSFGLVPGDYNLNVTHLQVIAWNQTNAQTALSQYSEGPARLYPISNPQQQPASGIWTVSGVTLPIPGGAAALCSMPVRWLEVRMVRIENDQIVWAGPTYTCAVLLRYGDYVVIDNNDPTNVEMNLQPAPSCEEGSWPAGAISRRRKPSPPPGVVPSVPLPSTIMPPISAVQ